MRQIKGALAIALLSFMALGCDDDPKVNVPAEVQKSFAQKYSSASRIEWEDKAGYKVADFRYNNVETSAWFDTHGTWYMTESDIPFSALPLVVQTSFKASEWASWRVDDVDMIEKKDSETLYIIEVEQRESEADIYYSADGIIIKVLHDNGYHENRPTPITNTIQKLVKEKYPNSRIVEISNEGGLIEVNIIDGNVKKEVYFDSTNKWVYTKTDVHLTNLPVEVANIVTTTQYVGYTIDDAEYVESPQGNYYLLELEKGNSEIKVKVDSSGKVVN